MADNTTLPGTGEVYASDDISGVKHQRVKISVGADGTAVDCSDANPLPVRSNSMLYEAARNGKAFTAAVSALLSNAEDLDLIITTPASPEVILFIEVDSSAFSDFYLYENATVGAGGTTPTTFDANRITDNTPGSVVKLDPTISSAGTLLRVVALGFSGKANTSFGGDSGAGLILKASEDYLIRITSLAAGNSVDVKLTWMEGA